MNDEINTELDSLEEDVEEFDLEAEGIVPPTDDATPGEDDELEYDDEGNIVIPDDDAGDASGEEDEDTLVEGEDNDDNNGSEDNDSQEDDAPPATEPVAADDKDAEIARLQAQLAERDALIKDTLVSLGADGNEGAAGLERLAAEAEDLTLDEYRARRAEKAKSEEAVRIVQRQEFEKKTLADLRAVQEAYPETKVYKTVFELPNFQKFARFRDAGLTPEEAYIAANGKAVMSSVATATKQASLNRTKDHIRSTVPKGAKDNSITISKKTLAEYRDLFPNMSDKEIVALYKQTMKK